VSRPPADSPLRPRSLWDGIDGGPDMSATAAEFDFRAGIPDARRFPFATWRALSSEQLRSAAVGRGAHVGAAGVPALRAAIARHVGVSRGVRADAEDVLVTSGSQQAIDLVARVLLAPGDVVAVENPGYPPPRNAFRALGCRVVGVPVDAEGLVVDALPDDARLVYVSPSHQFPLGMVMSLRRRRALLDWPNASTPPSSRTTTTASSASGADPSNRCTGSTPPAGCSTSARSRRCCCRRCGWAS
jgi:GntR family transcriptional regulator/MocR family aminotransferase